MGAEQSGPAWWDQQLVPVPSDLDLARGYLRRLQRRLAAAGQVGGDHVARTPLPTDVPAGRVPDSVSAPGREGTRNRRDDNLRVPALGIGRESSSTSEGLEQWLQDLLDEIVTHADPSADSASFRMAVGFLPIDGLDAILIEVPGDDDAYVIAMSEQVPAYVNLLAKSCAQLLPIRRSGPDVSIDLEAPAWPSRLGMDAPGVQRFLDLMFTSLGARPAKAEPYSPEADWLGPAEALWEAADAFLLARQFVHLVIDHDGPARVGDLRVGDERLAALRFSREQESDADVEALRLLLRMPRFDEHAAITCWGVDMLLASLAMLDALGAGGPSDEEAPGNLAPEQTWPGERRERLRDAMGEFGESRPGLVELMGALDPVGRALWGHLKRLMLQRDS